MSVRLQKPALLGLARPWSSIVTCHTRVARFSQDIGKHEAFHHIAPGYPALCGIDLAVAPGERARSGTVGRGVKYPSGDNDGCLCGANKGLANRVFGPDGRTQ